MYKSNKILAFIPARSGSKRLVGKNKKMLNNKPLFMYSVEIAQKSKYIDEIIVSSDSCEILDIAHHNGCIKNNIRPEKLSGDHARIIDSILYEIDDNNLNSFDSIVLLQPTFPIRTVEMLDEAIEKFYSSNANSLITVVKSKEQPLMMRTINNDKLEKIISTSSDIRSQDFPDVYKIIGCIYINKIKTLNTSTVLNENEVPFIIDNKYDIDIDTIDDFIRAEEALKK